MSESILSFLRQQKEFNATLQKQLQSQQNTINELLKLMTLSEKVPEVSFDKTWLPIHLYGTIKEVNKCFIYSFSRKETRYPYNSPVSRATAHQQALDKQISESLKNGRNNRYYVQNDVIHLELRDGSFALCDVADLNLISNKVWYPHKGHVISRVDGKRLKMSEVLTGKFQMYFENGNPLDNRRSNLIDNIISTTLSAFKLTKEEWTELKEDAIQNKETLTQAVAYLNDLVKDVPKFPLVSYTKEQIQEDYLRIAQSPTHDLVTCGLGGKISTHFMKEAIFHARKHGFQTIDEVWSNPNLRGRLFKAMIRLDMSSFDAGNLIRAFALNFYKVGNFPPLAARNLYDNYFYSYLQRSNLRVLDFCSGFGGRLIGFWTSQYCSYYIGIDPNPRLIQPYNDLIKWLRSQHTTIPKYITMIPECAEDVIYKDLKYEDGSTVKDNLFDIVFTSPPYFNLEIYTDEPTQSCIRYPTIEKWRDLFLFATIKKVIKVLKPGGVLAINIKDSNKWDISLCDQMVEFIKGLGLIPCDTINLNLSKRPGSNKESFEPIFIFTQQSN